MPSQLDPSLKVRWGRGGRRFQAMRETTAELCDLRLGGDESAFGVSTSTWHLGSALLIKGRSTPLHYDRTRAHVAASGLDHYQVQCYLRGGQSTEGGGRDYVLAPGDIGICDMARANRTIVDGTGPRQSAHFLTLFVPRALLAPLLSAPDGAHGAVVGGATPLGRMLAGQMLALSREAPGLVESERIAAVQAVTGLLAAGVGPAADAKVPVAQAMRDATLAAVKRYIDAMLLSDGLRPDAICRIFGLSRATLYRLFEPEGGIAAYVQARRLREAVSLLVSPLHRHLRLEDLASRHGFSSGAAFIRAFRRAFDMTPGEMKAMALGLHGREGGDADRWAKDAATANIAWIRTLAG